MKSSHFLLATLILISLLSVCSCSSKDNGEQKKIIDLPEGCCVISSDFTDEEIEIIYSQNSVILANNLTTNNIDTIMVVDDGEICDVVKTKSGYIVVTRTPEMPSMAYFAYKAYNINKENNGISQLYIDEEDPSVTSTAYIISKQDGTIILEGSEFGTNQATLYHTVYDFEGEKLIDDPTVIDLKPNISTISNSSISNSTRNVEYIWECNRCGKKINKSYTPDSWPGGDPCPSHDWVKIGVL